MLSYVDRRDTLTVCERESTTTKTFNITSSLAEEVGAWYEKLEGGDFEVIDCVTSYGVTVPIKPTLADYQNLYEVLQEAKSEGDDDYACAILRTAQDTSRVVTVEKYRETKDRFFGAYTSMEEFAQAHYRDNPALRELPDELFRAISWRDVAQDCLLAGGLYVAARIPAGGVYIFYA